MYKHHLLNIMGHSVLMKQQKKFKPYCFHKTNLNISIQPVHGPAALQS